ncbi:class I SAM-dependent methyltransferase [Pelagibius litoralis]|uniref:Class I SAM-dependent methyltransferase n=1 Tax=Pelagibius litoralis TaxID=374515 RepID=A0A967EX96_9PROT|nr:class I SAM-dependent methyltransferase [Pelagibius litoralis]NIA68405.1 class I SAM-dependent methyltransferase [Pelagibius litoralis]
MPQDDPQNDRLYRDRELAQFYDLENGWAPDFEYCLQLAKPAGSVLDLGCGTGQLATRLATNRSAGGREVTGVDPAAAMLDIARQRPGGDKVTWREADARTVRLGRQFDLVLLTGHAFQAFLTDSDQQAALATVAAHLAPQGRFIFDTRNPAAGAWRGWVAESSQRSLMHPQLGRVEAWNDANHDAKTGIVTYETHYRIASSERVLSATSKIRFTPHDRLAAILADAGLAVDEWLGDWEGGAYAANSREIIPLGRLA